MNRRHSRPSDAEVAFQLADDAPTGTRVWYLTLLAGVALAVVGLAVDVWFLLRPGSAHALRGVRQR